MKRWRKLGIIAGGGALPVRVAASCRLQDTPFHVIRIKGATDTALSDLPGDECGIGEAGKIIRRLKEEECDAVVFAGVVRRPDFSSLSVDWRGAALLPKVVAAATRGDGALLSVLVDTMESEGVNVVGVEETLSALAAPAGPLGDIAPSDAHFADIRKAAAVINALGEFDVGQGAVVAQGLVLAIEAAEGTDSMLARCASLPVDLLSGGGVLVKRPKPGQELRIDLPAIGPETVRRAKEAGLSGIAIEANVALIIDRDEVRVAANQYGLFVYGFQTSEISVA
ncbi:MAG: UDP-2,3-diacylglucosamine diphosphatase LpxI [Pseudomonadota bacterium]